MKHFWLAAAAIISLSGCAVINRPTCELPANVAPLPAAHTKPYEPEPWKSFDGSRFPYSVWKAHGEKARAVVILSPGWDGTMLDYTPLAEYLARAGFTVYGSEERTGVYDPSWWRRGNPSNWEDWVRDFQSFTNFVAAREPGLPLFYHGHSFGTLVVLQTAAQSRQDHLARVPRGIIIQSLAMPFLIEKENPALQAGLFATIGGVRFPQLTLMELLKSGPTGDKVLNCQWERSPDRLARGYEGRYFLEAARLGHQARVNAGRRGPPVLALEGCKDEVVAPKPDQKVAYHEFLTQTLRSGHATVIRYPNGYHTIVVKKVASEAQNRDSEKAKRDIAQWLTDRTGKP